MIALRVPPLLIASVAGFGLVGTAGAQVSAARVKAEITFARGLAADWTFVDLAEEVIEEVEDQGVSGKLAEGLSLAKCDVFAVGARHERDPEKRHELFEQAVTEYSQFLERNPYSDGRATAEAALIDTSAYYARSLGTAIEEAVGEEADELRRRQGEVLQAAIERTGELITSLEQNQERSETQTRELYTLMLNRGNMLSEFALSQEDGTYFFTQSVDALEGLVFAAGEGTPPALRAYVAIGDVYSNMGVFDEAASYYESVIDLTIPVDLDTWNLWVREQKITDAEKELRFLFLELSIGGLMKAYIQTGDLDAAAEYGLHYYNTQRREGFNFTPRGYLSLLEVARALLDSNGFVGGNVAAGEAKWFATEDEMKARKYSKRNQADTLNLALRIAQSINDENKGNTLQVTAQKLISEIITRPGTTASPEILFEAAQGEYYAQNYFAALDGFRSVLRSIEGQDQATRIEYGARVMNHVGNSYRKLNRPIEAAMAFREGCTVWLGDLEYDEKNAQGYYRMIQEVERDATLGSDSVKKLVSEAERVVAEVGSKSADEVAYNLGKKAAKKPLQDYAQAASKFEEIPKGSDYWEKAQVEIGICKWRLKDTPGAIKVFDSYLEEYLNSTDAATTSPTKLARRKEASATAEFYRGMLTFNQAGKSKDKAKYANVVKWLQGYYTKYPEQTTLSPWTMQLVMSSQLALDKKADARKTLDDMVATYPDDKRTGRAAKEYYDLLVDQAGDAPSTEHLQAMAELIELYNRVSPSTQFKFRRDESKLWIDLANWPKAEGALRRIVTKYGDDTKYADNVRKYVTPDLGLALLKQKKVAESKDLLAPLVESGDASKSTVLDWCHSVSGWVEGPGDDIQIVPGAGETEEEYELATQKMAAIAGSGDKWVSCEWYYQKFMVVYTYHQWSELNSRKVESAERQLDNLIDELGPQFDLVDENCSTDETTSALRESLGGHVLRMRFIWLKNQIKG